MLYGDPDYGVGVDYAGKKYTQKWDDYIRWYGELAGECMRVLHPRGNLFLLNYPRQNAHLRVRYLEAAAARVNEYVWVYPTNVGHSPRRFTTAHRSVLHATKSADNRFYKSQVALPYKNPTDRRIRRRLADGEAGRMPYSWFEFNLVKNVSRDKTFHACQIPLALFEMLVNAATKKGDLVFVLFGGSGGELVRAREMGRVFRSCEIHRPYYDMICERLANGGEVGAKHRLPRGAKKRAAAPGKMLFFAAAANSKRVKNAG